MIAWLALAAHAGLIDEDNRKNACNASRSYPIVGTAGFANTLEAFRTNAATYSASSYVEKHALRRIAMSDSGEKNIGVAVLDANFVYGVTRVPVYQSDVSLDGCPGEFLLSARAVDMYSYNGGGAYRFGRVGFFYAAAATFSYPAELTYLRAYQSVGSIYLGPAFLASAMFGSLQTASGASAYAQDAILGAIVDAEIADVRAGYTRSRGWYASVQDHYIGLFGSIVLRDGLQLVGQFRGGAERIRSPEKIREKVGATSAFARLLPLTETDGEDPEAEQVDLLTGHLEQEGIAGILDLRAAYAVRPVPQIHEASIAIHDRGFYAYEDGEDTGSGRHFYLEAGFIRLPPLYYYGVQGGTRVHLRGELVLTPASKEGRVQASFGLLFNDPEQTALYPFAVDALSGKASIKGSF
jgi:hypothetical protein